MRSRLRIVTKILGALFTLQGVGWIVTPTRAAEGLGMPLLEGMGRSTQIGDFATFFLTAGVTILLGSRPGGSRLLFVPAGMFASAAVLRTFAWLLHGADFAATFIFIELAASVLLFSAAQRFAAADARLASPMRGW